MREATATQTLPDWIGAHARALSFIGGARSAVADCIYGSKERSCSQQRRQNLATVEMTDIGMNEVLQSILSTGSVVTEDGELRTCDVGIGQDEGEFLQEIIRGHRPQVSVEIGCAYGISSLYICEALREVNAAKHIIIDPWQHAGWQDIGVANLKRAGYADLIDFHEAPSYQYLERLTEEGGVKIDFAFIDGNHTFDYVLVDFFLIDQLLKPRGIVVLDDFTYPSIRSVCRYVLLNRHYKCIGPQSRKLPELAQWQRLASRLRQGTIGPLLRSPWRRVLMPAWRMIVWRGGRLVSAPMRRLLVSRNSVSDSQLNLPDGVNYVALQKLRDDDRDWTDWKRHIPF